MPKTARVLIVEDSVDDCDLMVNSLKKEGFDVVYRRVESGRDLISALNESVWDIVISDYNLPSFNGMDALKLVRAKDADIPFVLRSGTVGESVAVAAMKSGASDYIMKDDSLRLVPAIERQLKEAGERKALAKALRESEELVRQSQKIEAIGQLAGGIAHDFNNILAIILLSIDRLIDYLQRQPNAPVNVATDIKKTAERAAELTRQLLAFGRRQHLEPKILDVNESITSTVQLLKRLVGENIEIQTRLEPGLKPIYVDPSQLTQVILNLAVNARDAMPDGGRLTIETNNIDLNETYRRRHIGVKPGPYVMLSISDTGSGIEAELTSRIFEPFFTTKEKGKGTGLGLSTVLGIVKQSGGDISLHSEIGVGTTFNIFLPQHTVGENILRERSEPQILLKNSGRILLVEDEEILREVAAQVLREAGYEVIITKNGSEALEFINKKTESIDLILTDMVMPGMSGPELIQKIRAISTASAKSARVIFMSGYSAPETLDSTIAAGKAVFLQKPFTSDRLLKKVAESLS